MDVVNSTPSEFSDILLSNSSVNEAEKLEVVKPSQSPHIGDDLALESVELVSGDVNKNAGATINIKIKDEFPAETISTEEHKIETQIPNAIEVNIALERHSPELESDTFLKGINTETIIDDKTLVQVLSIKDDIPVYKAVSESPSVHLSSNRSPEETPPDLGSATVRCEPGPQPKETSPGNLKSDAFLTPQNAPSTEHSSNSNDAMPSAVSQASPSHPTTKSSDSSPIILPPSPISHAAPSPKPPDFIEKHNQLQAQLKSYESQIEQLKRALSQKDNTITLFQRENALLEKEKLSFRKEKEIATREKESIVIKFATKEKSLIDAKKQKETIEKQLADSRKEVKNISTKFHALNEEKSRITYMLDEKCNEVKKYQKEFEKQKTELNNIEMKLKWNSVKLAQETEGKLAAEKKLDEERNAPKPHEEKANEKIKVEYEATAILLKHEIENKDKTIEALTKENKQSAEKLTQLQESMSKEILENTSLSRELECLRQEHAAVQNSYSEEMLNSAKLRGQLEELQVLRTQHTINEDKISTLNENLRELEDKLLDSTQDMEQLQAKEQELLSINKEMSEMIVGLQNDICLQTSKVKGIEAENEILKKEKLDFDTKYNEIKSQLKQEIEQKNDERLLLTKHLSEKTKMYESVKVKLENAQGDLDATKKKHSQVVKELQRELQKYKKFFDENSSPSSPTSQGFCRNCQLKSTSQERIASSNSRGSNNSRSDSESEAQSTTSTMNRDVQGPSKQHLVERILRLQQASARQTEKIDFLENHTLSLVAELQKKSKVVQYYMMRDQAGALTSSKSDQNKSELAKYGGVMSAIYSGIKGPNVSMTLELSLEINKKLQAVLEDTLLKNITLKENLDVLGLEVDKLTRKIAQLKS